MTTIRSGHQGIDRELTGSRVKRRAFNRTKLNLFLDLVIAMAFVVELQFRFTGLRVHELLGLAFATGIGFHILLHWDWIIAITKKFFQNLFHTSRLNYVVNLILFIDIVVAIVTGLGISRTLGLNFHLTREAEFVWRRLHTWSSDLSLLLVGLHVALHWKWIVKHSQKYIFNLNFLKRLRPSQVHTQSITERQE